MREREAERKEGSLSISLLSKESKNKNWEEVEKWPSQLVKWRENKMDAN